MGKFNTGASKLILLGALLVIATPVHAAQVVVSANAGHFLRFDNGNLSNQSVYTDQHSIENTLPASGGAPGAIVRRDNGVVTSGAGSAATSFAVAASESESEAYAYGDLAAGKVGAYAGTGPAGFASSSAIISDTLTFNITGANAGTITPLRLLVSLHAATPDATGVFDFRLGAGRILRLGALNQPYYGITEGWSQSSSWLDGSTRYFDLTLDLMGANPTVGISMTLEAIASQGSVSDFYHTAGLQLQAPRGVTYTSDSGVFLTGGGVPEPSAWAMLIMGFGAAGAVIRRRKRFAA